MFESMKKGFGTMIGSLAGILVFSFCVGFIKNQCKNENKESKEI